MGAVDRGLKSLTSYVTFNKWFAFCVSICLSRFIVSIHWANAKSMLRTVPGTQGVFCKHLLLFPKAPRWAARIRNFYTFAFLKHNCWSNSCSTSIAFSLSIQWSPTCSFSPNLFCKWLKTIIFLKKSDFFQWRTIALQNFEQPFIISQDFVAWWVVVLPVFLASSCIFSQMAVRMVGRSQMARSVG